MIGLGFALSLLVHQKNIRHVSFWGSIPNTLMIDSERITFEIIARALICETIIIRMKVRHWKKLGERSPNFWKVGWIFNNTPKGGLMNDYGMASIDLK